MARALALAPTALLPLRADKCVGPPRECVRHNRVFTYNYAPDTSDCVLQRGPEWNILNGTKHLTVKKETRLVLTYKLPEGGAEVKHVARIRIDGSAGVQLYSTSDGPAEIVEANALAWLRYEAPASSPAITTVGALIH